MKTNVQIELTDAERTALASFIAGKQGKRKVTRAEVVTLCRQFIGGMLGQAAPTPEDRTASGAPSTLYSVDQEDRAALAGKPAGFIRGWNMVKRSSNRSK